LIGGLEGTKIGWIEKKKTLLNEYEFLIGDVLLSSAFLSYAGPFPAEYRRSFIRDLTAII